MVYWIRPEYGTCCERLQKRALNPFSALLEASQSATHHLCIDSRWSVQSKGTWVIYCPLTNTAYCDYLHQPCTHGPQGTSLWLFCPTMETPLRQYSDVIVTSGYAKKKSILKVELVSANFLGCYCKHNFFNLVFSVICHQDNFQLRLQQSMNPYIPENSTLAALRKKKILFPWSSLGTDTPRRGILSLLYHSASSNQAL